MPQSMWMSVPQDRGIGRDLALLYEAYATFLELKGNFPRADLVYQEGVNRCASETGAACFGGVQQHQV